MRCNTKLIEKKNSRSGGKFSSSPCWNIAFSICLNKPTAWRGKVEREKHTNLFPISFLISAENDVLWPVISFNTFIWVIFMDIVISSEPDPASGSGQAEEGRGEEGRVSRRMDIKIWREQSHYSDIPFIWRGAGPIGPTLISARGDWQATSRTL